MFLIAFSAVTVCIGICDKELKSRVLTVKIRFRFDALHQRRLGLESYKKRFDKNSQAFFLCYLLLSPTYLFCFGRTK